MSTRFTRQTDLKRSSGLRLSTPVRSLVERVAESAGLTYSDAIRLLVEEALAARAGIPTEHLASDLDAMRFVLGGVETKLVALESLPEIINVLELLRVTTDLWRDALHRDEDTMKEIRNETARILHSLGGWPVWNANQVREMQQKIDAMQWQIEKVLDLLAEKTERG
jgi:antitoxin component of RelBE/YafQ-DinJ toxin-antitoxin module